MGFLFGVLTLGIMVGIAGCAGALDTAVTPEPIGQGSQYGFTEHDILLNDGTVVPCITWIDGMGSNRVGGVDCDWDKRKGTK